MKTSELVKSVSHGRVEITTKGRGELHGPTTQAETTANGGNKHVHKKPNTEHTTASKTSVVETRNRKINKVATRSAKPFPASSIPAVNVAAVPQRSPLRYPGGKTWLIPHIRHWLESTEPEILIEPFAGGAIVSLTAVMENLAKTAVMVEIDRDVAAFWRSALEAATLCRNELPNSNPPSAG